MNTRYDIDEAFKDLLRQGKMSGSLTTEEILEAIDSLPVDLEQLDEFYEKCSEFGIEIIDAPSLAISELSNNAKDSNYVSLDPVREYLNEIGKIPLISAKEEQELGRLIKKGNTLQSKQAQAKLVEANLRLVVSIAKKYSSRMSQPFLDIIQNGNLGLMKAAETFDYEKGFKFSTYATWWIKQSITRCYSETARSIRLPNYMLVKVNQVKNAIDTLMAKTGKTPSMQEIAEYMNISVESAMEAFLNSQDIAYLNTPIGEDKEGSCLIDFIPDNKNAFSELINHLFAQDLLDEASNYLSDREIEVMKRRFGFFDGQMYTLNEIAKQYHLTREKIQMIEAQALRKIRDHLKQKETNNE